MIEALEQKVKGLSRWVAMESMLMELPNARKALQVLEDLERGLRRVRRGLLDIQEDLENARSSLEGSVVSVREHLDFALEEANRLVGKVPL